MQNALLRTRLSEFHSGYRAYSVPALRRIRFPLNSNDFHFDTEIIIQLLNAGQRIVEVPIPTHYGDEICYVDGVRYAKDVTLTTLQMVAHGVGVFNQRRFEPLDDDGHANSHYDVKLGYPSSHQFALDAVPSGGRVLEGAAASRRPGSVLGGEGPAGAAGAGAGRGGGGSVPERCAPAAPPSADEAPNQPPGAPPVFDARKY